MRQILPAADTAGKLLGTQKLVPNTVYRLSRHCLRVPCADGELLYLTLTGALWLAEPGETPEACVDALVPAWFLVPRDFDENKLADDLRALAGLMLPKKSVTSFTILTTTDCNARCFYCYELGQRRFPMTDQTARDTAAHIARVCGGKPVKLRWFGGEPLYNRAAIEIITAELRERGVSFSSSMTSNGYYLDAATARTAVDDWRLTAVQITLDGTREVYNRAKAYIDRDGDPFTRVLDNIASALDAGIGVSIRLNMNRNNADDLMRLADELSARFDGKRAPHVYVAVLQDFVGPVQGFGAPEDETERALALWRKLRALGLNRTAPLSRELRVHRCMADNDASEAIMPDGRIITCEHFDAADTVGHVRSDERVAALLRAWKETAALPECADCPLYPRCVNLKRCPWVRDACPASRRALRRYQLETEVLAAYEGWKSGQREEVTT